MREWKAAYEKLKKYADVKEVELISIAEATQDGKINIWNAFRERSLTERDMNAHSLHCRSQVQAPA
jgi:hypothetical protein